MTGYLRLLAVLPLIVAVPALPGQSTGARVPAEVIELNSNQLHSSPPERVPSPALPRKNPTLVENPSLPQSVFEQLVRSAGIIFSGRVISVGTSALSSSAGHASTSIIFQVEHAMRGASPGQNLTIHEWAGLWASGERYRVGDHVFLFLYAPSKLGLTSPVAGPMGRFAVDSRGMIVMSPKQIATFNKHPMLGAKTVVSYADFAVAVRRVQPEGRNEP